MSEDEQKQQHLPEVAVMGRDLLDLLVLLREPAEPLHGLV
jgi:hypothetical protein